MSPMTTTVTDLLQEANILLQGLFSNTLFGVSIWQDNRFVFVNERFAEIFGYTQTELCMEINPLDLAIPEDRTVVQQAIRRRLSGEVKSSSYSFRGRHKNGSQLDIEIYGTATQFNGKPAIIGILHDITERRRAERAADERLNFITQLMNTIPNPVFYKDEKGRYLGCNAAFEQFIGLKREHLIGRTVYDIAPKELADIYFAADQALFDHPGTQSYEAIVTDAEGSERNVVFSKATFNKGDGSLGGMVGVILDISDRKQLEETIWHQANYDSLTGLPNRRRLQDRLTEELKRAQRNTQKLAVLFIDLDRFKKVNDVYGHNAGDSLLTQAAQRICSVVRASDTVSRLGGDEFIVILPELSDSNMAGLVAQKIIDALTAPYDLAGQPANISASIGIARYPDDSTNMEMLLCYADRAMYAAKSLGRGCFCFLPVF